MLKLRRHTRIAIEQKTVRVSEAFPPVDVSLPATHVGAREAVTLNGRAEFPAVTKRVARNPLRSIYQALRRALGWRTPESPRKSAASPIALVAKSIIPPSKEPRA